jgi:transcriptional regulator with AAA-type ATPase domain
LYHREGDTKLTTFDCGAFPENLVVSELFGHKKGAFTGATEDRMGLLKQCHKKMLFLDEIGNLPPNGQDALLRYVERGEIRPLGSGGVQKVNTQIIAATNKKIHDSTLFAQDLKDRFHEMVEIPSLRDRKEDIPLLVDHFLRVYSKKQHNAASLSLKREVVDKLREYDWPGNTRELEMWIQKLHRRFSEGGEISLKDLPAKFISNIMKDEAADNELPDLPLHVPLTDFVESIREKARKQSGGNMAVVDRLLCQKLGTEKQRQYRRKQQR